MARVAFILDELFEDSEFQVPYDRVRDAGHEPVIVGLQAGKDVTGKNGSPVTIERGIDEVGADEFDALVIPGGYSPDKIRTSEGMVALTRDMHQALKPVAAICHAGWMLAEADIIRGKTVTSYHSIKTDLRNAGAEWVDEEVVRDGSLVTSRKPDDLPAFNAKVVEEVAEGRHERAPEPAGTGAGTGSS
jgi:deglycase